MRRIKGDYCFDLWLQELSPSEKLLEDYNAGYLDWDAYVQRFSEEVLNNPEKTSAFTALKELARKGTVTLLCHEESDKKCHRRLLIEKIRTDFMGSE
ncbi:MAG: DUF488 domain-containing protein [Synergistaceae bacterium]|jgi:uncharacterized protein YeaO (DUF488 family)|nr:DUF488 domain-containing protein [Synergistaceae bacterium]